MLLVDSVNHKIPSRLNLTMLARRAPEILFLPHDDKIINGYVSLAFPNE